MERILLKSFPEDFPEELKDIFVGSDIYDSSCSRAARVYFIDKDNGYYLKISEVGTLAREALMTEYYGKIGLGAKVLKYISKEKDFLLTERVAGEDLTHAEYLEEPEKLAEFYGKLLRKLHETNGEDCPIQDRLSEALLQAKNYRDLGKYSTKTHIPERYNPLSADEAWKFIEENKHRLTADTLTHGDYCLPNTIAETWNFSGFIDVGNGGISDRHFDIFWGAWTLEFNLKTDKYAEIFFNAYGKDRIDMTALKTVAYIEAFC